MARLKLSRAASFWLLATVFAFFLFAAGAPSPLYVVYESIWHFSSLTLTAIFGVYALALLAAPKGSRGWALSIAPGILRIIS
jgi:hypothetical protein